MAIDKLLYREADNLARAEKSFYPLRIPVSHWQLRHYISNPEPDLLYYASGCDIYCLDTATKKRKLIVTLPFEARCTASGYGWVCVSGEDLGHFAAIKLDGSGPRTLDVDSALPIEPWRAEGGRRAASVKLERMGEDIVNSISIHRIQDEEAHLDDIVAVLTNNDKTVRMYSLPSNVETWIEELPYPMNHATVSPDGQTLVAVGDVNQAFFFQREILEKPPQIHKPHNRLTSASLKWVPTSEVNLPMPEPNTSTGYFTTAWSPNGQLVAVGSEGGYITVFDVDMLYDPDLEDHQAIVATVQGSRPDLLNPHPGAIRAMMFSPDPWDLLIWAEDQDRVCIGDLRAGLKSRQIINLEPKDDTLKKIPFEDLPADDIVALSMPPARDLDDVEAEFFRRYRQAPDRASAVNFASEYIESRRRQQRQHRQETVRSQLTEQERLVAEMAAESHPEGLDAREQQLLDSLRTTRQREEARTNGVNPRAVNYTREDMFRDPGSNRSSTATPAGDPSSRPISEILSSVQDALPELARTNAASPRPGSSYGAELPPLSALAGMGSNYNTGLVRLGDGSRLPRRRASVVLNLPNSNTASAASSNGEANGGSTSSSNRATATGTADEDIDPWRNIEEHMTLARGPLFERERANADSASRPTETETAERARFRSLARQRERWRTLNATERAAGVSNSGGTGNSIPPEVAVSAASLGAEAQILLRRAQQMGAGYALTRASREIGVRTAGLAMSGDGRTLWAACEEGIFEIKVGVKGRMFWPSLQPR